MAKKKNIILWDGDRAKLYCSHMNGDRWHVINGNWTLLLSFSGLKGVVEKTGAVVQFTKKTIAPAPLKCHGKEEYNEVMMEAERQENANTTPTK